MTTKDSIRPDVRTEGADNRFVRQPVPFLKSDEEQIARIRRQLEGMFRELRLVQDVIRVCGAVAGTVGFDLDDEVEHVLHRCGSDRLHSILKTLTQIVERFGGSTEMSEGCQADNQPSAGLL